MLHGVLATRSTPFDTHLKLAPAPRMCTHHARAVHTSMIPSLPPSYSVLTLSSLSSPTRHPLPPCSVPCGPISPSDSTARLHPPPTPRPPSPSGTTSTSSTTSPSPSATAAPARRVSIDPRVVAHLAQADGGRAGACWRWWRTSGWAGCCWRGTRCWRSRWVGANGCVWISQEGRKAGQRLVSRTSTARGTGHVVWRRSYHIKASHFPTYPSPFLASGPAWPVLLPLLPPSPRHPFPSCCTVLQLRSCCGAASVCKPCQQDSLSSQKYTYR